ncbi:MAG: hypothetical protein IJ849_07285 [Selenomonadaceae bacterium]|nr:hypothetical protein [Selenomonadaceae bacterium]
MAMIRMTKEEIDAYMTSERMREEEERARNMPFVYDEDCPPQTDEQLKHFHRANSIKKAG